MVWSQKSAGERGYDHRWRKRREATFGRDHYLCQACRRAGRITLAAACDHIVPKAQGGSDEMSNLQALCRQCHEVKSLLEQGKQPRVRIGVDGWPCAEVGG